MRQHGGKCYLGTLFEELPDIDRESIRQCLNLYSTDIENLKVRSKIFYCINNAAKKGGLWGLRHRNAVSYRTLINEYLILNESATIDELYEYIQSFLHTGKTGKTYLKTYLIKNYKNDISFNYINNTVAFNSSKKKLPFKDFLVNLASSNQNYFIHKVYKRTSRVPHVLESFPGEINERQILSAKQNRIVVDLVKLRDNYTCQICNFSYEKLLVEPHIINPLTTSEKDTAESGNLITLCPNCHHLAHLLLQYDFKYTDKEVLIEKLKELTSKQNN